MAEAAKEPPSLKGSHWLMDPALQDLLAALGRDRARIVGGAVRNALMGEQVDDIDIATVWPPQETMKWAAAAGFTTHPVAVDHGSVIVTKRGRVFEVTTLRHDVETDGRHAKVAFTADWAADAARRDFTMNALYADAGGRVFDPLGGYPDLAARRVRFIGRAQERIREDYLRILRFFRFWARYGEGPPDEEALAACGQERQGLERISRERIHAEMERLLAAPRAPEALLHMQETGVLDHALPAGCARDFSALARMAADDAAHGLRPEWTLRLAALCGPCEAEELKAALRLSRRETAHLALLREKAPPAHPDGWRALAYRRGASAAEDLLRLAHARGTLDDDAFRAGLAALRGWEPPEFPLSGADVIRAGAPPGPQVGRILRRLEDAWLAAGFRPRGRRALLSMLREIVRKDKEA